MKNIENMGRVMLGTAALACLISVANCDLYLYDNFASSTTSDTLWAKSSVWDNSRVTWSAGYAGINMTITVANKWAYMQMNQAVNLADESDTFRVTWDMQIATAEGAASNGYFNGLSIGSSSLSLKAGQAGASGGNFPWQTFIDTSKNGTGSLGQQWLHYDLTVASTTQTLKVYIRNTDYDADPTLYESTGASWSKTISNLTLPTATDMELRLWVNDPYAVDAAISPRDTVYYDNVFTSVPEPASMMFVSLGVFTLGIMRKRFGGK